MFTGIVEQVGVVASLIRGQQSAKLMIAAPKIFEDLKDSECDGQGMGAAGQV